MVVTGSIVEGEPNVRPGTTPLHMAAQNGNISIIRALLQVSFSTYVFTITGQDSVAQCPYGHSSQTLDSRKVILSGEIRQFCIPNNVIQTLEEQVGFPRPVSVQAHVNEIGIWGDVAGGQRSSWEGNAMLDLRAARDSHGLLAYHAASNHNMWSISQLLNPGIPILRVINDVGASHEGKRILLAPPDSLLAYCHICHCARSKPMHILACLTVFNKDTRQQIVIAFQILGRTSFQSCVHGCTADSFRDNWPSCKTGWTKVPNQWKHQYRYSSLQSAMRYHNRAKSPKWSDAFSQII